MARHLDNALYDETRNASGSVVRVRELIAAGADATRPARSSGGRTPLAVAAANGRTDLVAELLTAGASVNALDTNGVTPLYLAATNGHEPTVELLLAHGADPNAARPGSSPPLWAAVYGGFAGIVTRLVRAGAAVDFEYRGKAMPAFAESCGWPEIARALRHARWHPVRRGE
jgi:ankyrin repeat protein